MHCLQCYLVTYFWLPVQSRRQWFVMRRDTILFNTTVCVWICRWPLQNVLIAGFFIAACTDVELGLARTRLWLRDAIQYCGCVVTLCDDHTGCDAGAKAPLNAKASASECSRNCFIVTQVSVVFILNYSLCVYCTYIVRCPPN